METLNERSTRYDVIIIGTGAGGGTLAYRLAPSGKRILLLERGDYVPREKDNWSTRGGQRRGPLPHQGGLARQGRQASSTRTRNYYVGGNTKFYGAALFRLRKEDFGELRHHGGVSPAWPISYDELEPYYTEAEHLYQVHGQRGEDPTEPPASAPVPASAGQPRAAHPAARRRPRAPRATSRSTCRSGSCSTSRIRATSPCIRCDTCDGFPCLVDAKADAQVLCVDPALAHPNVTLLTDAYVSASRPSASGREVTTVHVERERRARDLLGRHRRRRVRRDQLGGAAAALGERPASRTASPTARTSSAATTCATSTRC